MLKRNAHFWLCCFGDSLDRLMPLFADSQVRVGRKGDVSRLGRTLQNDYLFIDAAFENKPIEFLIESVLDRLEPNHAALGQLGVEGSSGIRVNIESCDTTFAESVSASTFSRLATLGQEVTFSFTHIPPEPGC
jgi:hypothetical protein